MVYRLTYDGPSDLPESALILKALKVELPPLLELLRRGGHWSEFASFLYLRVITSTLRHGLFQEHFYMVMFIAVLISLGEGYLPQWIQLVQTLAPTKIDKRTIPTVPQQDHERLDSDITVLMRFWAFADRARIPTVDVLCFFRVTSRLCYREILRSNIFRRTYSSSGTRRRI